MFLQRFAHSYPLFQAILHLVAQRSWIRTDNRPGTPEETAQKLKVASVDLFHRWRPAGPTHGRHMGVTLPRPELHSARFGHSACQWGTTGRTILGNRLVVPLVGNDDLLSFEVRIKLAH
jgi:hypothetical protein